MIQLLKIIVTTLLSLVILINTNVTYAATFKTGESVDIPESEKTLKDAYLFGETVTVDGPVQNDLTAAGGSLTFNGNISGSLLAAGGNLYIRSHVGNTIRVAGGEIVISGPVDNDVVIAAGTARVTKSASISGDLIFTGGKLDIEAPIKGNVTIYAGAVNIDSTVNGNVNGEVGELMLGNSAVINGNLVYKADNKAKSESNAVVKGKHEYTKIEPKQEKPKGLVSAFTISAFYKLVVDIIITLLLITYLPLFVTKILTRNSSSPLSSAGSGLIFLLVWPALCIFLLLFFWLGFASLFLYALALIIALFMTKIQLGYWILQWWNKREKKTYDLDWKAAIVGSISLFILLLIPLLGWLTVFIIFLISLGGIVHYSREVLSTQRIKKIK